MEVFSINARDKKKVRILLLALIALILVIVGCFIFKNATVPSEPATSLISNSETESVPEKVISSLHAVQVASVVDGDTLWVIQDGIRVKVRLIGVDTPESVHKDKTKNTAEGEAASNYTKSRLKAGETIYLQYDVEKEDKYQRVLAYVWLTDAVNTSSYDDICTYMYNAELLKNGYAKTMFVSPNFLHKEALEKLSTH